MLRIKARLFNGSITKLIYFTIVFKFIFVNCIWSLHASEQMPVSIAKNGFNRESAYALREGFSWDNAYTTGDRNLYSFLHWEEFVHHNTVARSGMVRVLEVNPLPSIGQTKATSSLGKMTLDEMISNPRSRIQGFVVAKQGRIVYEQYPGMRDWDHHLWFSVSKTVTALLVGLLEDEGKIDVEQTIDAYLPELISTSWRGIRIIDILDMASGLNLAESEEARNDSSNLVNHFFRQEIGFHTGSLTSDDVIQSVKKQVEPGEIFEYSSLNTRMLGLLVERVAGQRMADLITERVWSKIGAEGDALIAVNPQGQAGMYGLFSSRLRDMVRYGMLYTPSWDAVSSERIIPTSLLAKVQNDCRPHIYEKGAPKQLESTDIFRPRCNSRQWDAVFDDGDLYKGGARGQGLYISPGRDIVVAWFSTTLEEGLRNYARAVAESFDLSQSANE